MRTNSFMIPLVISLSAALCISPKAFASGTVVGNGGDPIFEFLRTTKETMNDTIKFILSQKTEQQTFCQHKSLNSEQVIFCRDYFMSIAPGILKLTQGLQQTPFILRKDPLYVVGPDGSRMMVAARTNLGPTGPIEFHRDSIKTLAPTQVLFLIAHEFEHKVPFQDRFISDNEQIGPFNSGRDLLDAVATSLVTIAKQNGHIGMNYGIRDFFQCTARNEQTQFGAQIVSSRLFKSENLENYETSFGKKPLDGSLFFQEDFNTVIKLRFTIEEPNNCQSPSEKRKTTIQIVRSSSFSTSNAQEEVLESKELNSNPMCPETNPQLRIESQGISFSCQYFGSEGTTTSPFAIPEIE